MKQKGYTEEQISFALRQAESESPVHEICRWMGISEPTLYRWKKNFAGMGVAEIRRLKQLEDEKRKLKQLVADLTYEKLRLTFSRRTRVRRCPRISHLTIDQRAGPRAHCSRHLLSPVRQLATINQTLRLSTRRYNSTTSTKSDEGAVSTSRGISEQSFLLDDGSCTR